MTTLTAIENLNLTLDADGQERRDASTENTTTVFELFQGYPSALLNFAGACCILFMIFGIPANAISIVALAKAKTLRNVTTPLVINLCVVGLLFCCFNLPFSASDFLDRQWTLGDDICKGLTAIRFSFVALNLFTVMAIAINRYVIIVHPSYYRKFFNKYSLVFTIVSIWTIPLLMLTPSLFEVWGRFGFDKNVGTCSMLPDKNGRSQKISLFVSAFAIPILVFVYCYVRIYWVVKKSHMRVKRANPVSNEPGTDEIHQRSKNCAWVRWFNSKQENRKQNTSSLTKNLSKNMLLVRTILVIFCTFIVCYLPQAILKALKKEREMPVVNVFGYLVMDFPNCINPVIYVIMSKEYRQAYRDLFYCYRHRKTSNTDSTDDKD